MKKTLSPTKLSLGREVVRVLDSTNLAGVGGGISGNRQCNYSQFNCDSMAFSNCAGCKSDVCTFE